jgi:hypothetical protein
MSDHSPFPRILGFSLAVIFALHCASAAKAQSGRRAKTPPAPAAAAIPEPTPVPAVAKEQTKPVLKLIVGIEAHDGFSSVSISTHDGVLRSCAARLDEPTSVSVDQIERPMSRNDVTKLAKSEKLAYVVWLRIHEDEMGSSQTGTPNNAYIEYMVLAPITAKVVASGATYPRKSIASGTRLPSPNGDYEFNDAARATANKILSALQMHIPPNVSD